LNPLLQPASLDQQFPEAQIIIRQFGQGPPLFADIEYRLYGPSIEVLQDLGEQVRLELQSDRDVLHTQASTPRGQPKLWFDADEDLAHLAGAVEQDAEATGNLLTYVPLLLFVGGDFWPSLSIVLAGGVGGSMILALLFVPAVYVLIQRRGVNSLATRVNSPALV
jgi:multidrug efflux pump subunit AcrB